MPNIFLDISEDTARDLERSLDEADCLAPGAVEVLSELKRTLALKPSC